MRFARVLLLLSAFLASSALLGACGDDPFLPEVLITTDTVTLTIPGTTAPSALDLARVQEPFTLLRRPELLQDADEWDIALRRSDGGLAFRPYHSPGSPLRGAGIATTPDDYDSITEAPRGDNAYVTQLVAATAGGVYFFRSRQYPTGLGGICVNYAKAKVLEVDPAAGTVRLAIVLNDNCDDERLVRD